MNDYFQENWSFVTSAATREDVFERVVNCPEGTPSEKSIQAQCAGAFNAFNRNGRR